MRVLLVSVLVAFLAACATSPERRGDGPSEQDLAAVGNAREQARRDLASQSEQLWRAVEGGRIEPASLQVQGPKYGSSIAAVRRARLAEKDAASARALEYLEAYLVGEHLARETAAISEKIATLEVTAQITVDGEQKSYAELERLLSSEPNPQRRRRMQAAALPVIRALDPLHEEQERQLQQAVRALGYGSWAEVAALLRHADLQSLDTLGRDVLQGTEELYRKAFGEAVRREMDKDLGGLRRADVPRLFAGIAFEPRFPEAGAREALLATLTGMGLDPSRVRIDDREAPGKLARPICFPVDPPSDVRLSYVPAKLGRDWAPLFHEAGCAVFHAGAQTKAYEFKQLGSSATAEAFAVLFQRLTEDPVWLIENAKMSTAEASAHAAGAAARRLYGLRRAAGKLQWELALHKGAADPRGHYRATMEAAYLFPLGPGDAERYLVDNDEFLESADTVQAWVLAGMIEDSLVGQFGEKWWASPEAGKWLGSLWSDGARATPAELAKKLGAPGLQPAVLVSRLAAQAAPLLSAPAAAPTEPAAAATEPAAP